MQNRNLITGIFILSLINGLFLTGCQYQSVEQPVEIHDEQLVTSAPPNLTECNTQAYTTSFTPNLDSINFSKIIQTAPLPAYIYNVSANESKNISLNKSGQYVWVETVPLQSGTIEINAEIDRPEIDYHPVYLIRDHDFTNNDIDHAAKILFPNALGILSQDFSRYEIESELANVKLGQATELNSVTGQLSYQGYNGQEQDISRLQNQLNSMPEDSITPISEISFNDFGSFKVLNANHSLCYFKTSPNEINMKTDRACKILTRAEIESNNNPYELYCSIMTYLPQNPGGSIDQCVDTLIASLCPDGFIKVKVERALSINPETSLIYSAGYYYTFARSIGDATVPPIFTLNTKTEFINDPIYDNQAPTCSYEIVTLFADHSGVRYFNWTNAFDPINIKNQNVQLLSFSDIQSIIRVAAVSLANRETLSLSGKIIEIQRVILTNTIQPNPENSSEAYIAPSWIISATSTLSDHTKSHDFAFAISAIDGRFVPLVS